MGACMSQNVDHVTEPIETPRRGSGENKPLFSQQSVLRSKKSRRVSKVVADFSKSYLESRRGETTEESGNRIPSFSRRGSSYEESSFPLEKQHSVEQMERRMSQWGSAQNILSNFDAKSLCTTQGEDSDEESYIFASSFWFNHNDERGESFTENNKKIITQFQVRPIEDYSRGDEGASNTSKSFSFSSSVEEFDSNSISPLATEFEMRRLELDEIVHIRSIIANEELEQLKLFEFPAWTDKVYQTKNVSNPTSPSSITSGEYQQQKKAHAGYM